MPDAWVLTGPLGSSINLGSYWDASRKPNFGGGVRRPQLAANSLTDSVSMVSEGANVRQMEFPLLLASSGSYNGLDGLQSWLEQLSGPGAYLDLLLSGVATGEQVRFDVVHGEVDVTDYDPFIQNQGRRRAALTLLTQPFGYQPTWHLLASHAAATLPGMLAFTTLPSYGDWPGYLRIMVEPSQGAQLGVKATWAVDMVAVGIARSASLNPVLSGGSWTSPLQWAYQGGNPDGIRSTYARLTYPQGASAQFSFSQWAAYTIPSALEPAYRGRFRALGYMRLSGATSAGIEISLDSVADISASAPMASGALVASMSPNIAVLSDWRMVDLGPITLPAVGSGIQRSMLLRLWGRSLAAATTFPQNAEFQLDAVALVPAENAGMLTGGLAFPWFGHLPTMSRLAIDGKDRSVVISAATGNLGTVPLPYVDGIGNWRGDIPRALPNDSVGIVLAAAARFAQCATEYKNHVVAASPMLYFKMDETASTATAIDSSGYARHGSYGVAPGSWGIPGAFAPSSNPAVKFTGANQYLAATGLNMSASPFTWMGWVKYTTDPALSAFTSLLSFGTRSDITWGIGLASRAGPSIGYPALDYTNLAFMAVNTQQYIATGAKLRVGEWHHVALTLEPTGSKIVAMYLNGSNVATMTLPSTATVPTGPFFVNAGRWSGLVNVQIDEVAVYVGVMSGSRIKEQYELGIGPSAVFGHSAKQTAAVAVHYQPRFGFAKGI